MFSSEIPHRAHAKIAGWEARITIMTTVRTMTTTRIVRDKFAMMPTETMLMAMSRMTRTTVAVMMVMMFMTTVVDNNGGHGILS